MTARQQSIWLHCLSLFLSAPLPYTIKFTNYVLGAQSDPIWRPSISQIFQPSYAGTITAHNPYSDFRKKDMSRLMRKQTICICETKGADLFAVTAKPIIVLVFVTRIVQFLYFLNLKFTASSHRLCLHSSVCICVETLVV